MATGESELEEVGCSVLVDDGTVTKMVEIIDVVSVVVGSSLGVAVLENDEDDNDAPASDEDDVATADVA